MVQGFSDRVQAYRRNLRNEHARIRKYNSREKLLAAAKRGDKKARAQIEQKKQSARKRMSTKRKAQGVNISRDNTLKLKE